MTGDGRCRSSGTYLDSERASAREVRVASTDHVAVSDGRALRGAYKTGAAMAFVAVLDAGVDVVLRVAALDAGRGGVVRVLDGDVVGDDTGACVNCAGVGGRPVKRDIGRIKGICPQDGGREGDCKE